MFVSFSFPTCPSQLSCCLWLLYSQWASRGWSGCRCGCRCTDIRGVFGDLGCSCRNLHSLKAGAWLPLAHVVVWIMAEEVQVPPTSQSDPFLLLVPISWAAISLLQQQIFVLEHNSSTFRDLYLLTVHQALHLLTALWLPGHRNGPKSWRPAEETWACFSQLYFCTFSASARMKSGWRWSVQTLRVSIAVSTSPSGPAFLLLSNCCSLAVPPLGAGTNTWCWAEQQCWAHN